MCICVVKDSSVGAMDKIKKCLRITSYLIASNNLNRNKWQTRPNRTFSTHVGTCICQVCTRICQAMSVVRVKKKQFHVNFDAFNRKNGTHFIPIDATYTRTQFIPPIIFCVSSMCFLRHRRRRHLNFSPFLVLKFCLAINSGNIRRNFIRNCEWICFFSFVKNISRCCVCKHFHQSNEFSFSAVALPKWFDLSNKKINTQADLFEKKFF